MKKVADQDQSQGIEKASAEVGLDAVARLLRQWWSKYKFGRVPITGIVSDLELLGGLSNSEWHALDLIEKDGRQWAIWFRMEDSDVVDLFLAEKVSQ